MRLDCLKKEFVMITGIITKFKRKGFIVSNNGRIAKRLKKEHHPTQSVFNWMDKLDQPHNMETMTDQHIENSLRWFFENSYWTNRKVQIKCLWLERMRRMNNKCWNLENARLGKFGDNGKLNEKEFRESYDKI